MAFSCPKEWATGIFLRRSHVCREAAGQHSSSAAALGGGALSCWLRSLPKGSKTKTLPRTVLIALLGPGTRGYFCLEDGQKSVRHQAMLRVSPGAVTQDPRGAAVLAGLLVTKRGGFGGNGAGAANI